MKRFLILLGSLFLATALLLALFLFDGRCSPEYSATSDARPAVRPQAAVAPGAGDLVASSDRLSGYAPGAGLLGRLSAWIRLISR
jgi:hypothetical protein